ncbi:MAG: restriction endonuclease subunit S [Cytophagales bacterium]
MSEWKTYKLGDFAEINPRISLKQGKEYSFVEMKDLDATFKYVSPSTKKELKGGAKFQNGDTLFARITPCLENGKICQVKNLENNLGFGSTEFLVFRGKENISNSDFIYYLSRSEFVKNNAIQMMTGTSGRQRVEKSALEKLEITVPDLATQTAIAQILTSLDDKIELNLQMNQTLEAMAQALFKEWFVNFNFPGFDGKLVDGLPKGWRMGKLGEMVTIKRGGSPRPIQDFMAETGLRWLKISDVTSLNTPFVLGTKEYIKEEGLSKTTLLKTGALILSNSATPGIPKILNVDCCIHDGWLHFPTSKFSNEFLYLQFLMLRGELVQQANGSIFTNLKTDIVREFQVPIATNDVFENFDSIVKPIFNKLLNNTLEIQTLTRTRDTLLPKLMSGKIRVA